MCVDEVGITGVSFPDEAEGVATAEGFSATEDKVLAPFVGGEERDGDESPA